MISSNQIESGSVNKEPAAQKRQSEKKKKKKRRNGGSESVSFMKKCMLCLASAMTYLLCGKRDLQNQNENQENQNKQAERSGGKAEIK